MSGVFVMRIYKCNKNQENRRDSELIGKLISLPTQYRLDSTVGDIAKEYNIAPYRTYITSVRPVNDPSGNYILGGGSYTLSGMEYDDHRYGYQIATGIVGQIYRILVNGIWGEWTKNILSTDFELVGCVVNGISGSVVEIPGSPPSSDYIPVITGHQNTLVANDNVYWQDNQKKWFFYTNVSQTVWLRFYKYPV